MKFVAKLLPLALLGIALTGFAQQYTPLTNQATSLKQARRQNNLAAVSNFANAVSGARPVYPGEKHTESHGGTYTGGQGGSSHKGGTYTSPTGQHVYGRHQK